MAETGAEYEVIFLLLVNLKSIPIGLCYGVFISVFYCICWHDFDQRVTWLCIKILYIICLMHCLLIFSQDSAMGTICLYLSCFCVGPVCQNSINSWSVQSVASDKVDPHFFADRLVVPVWLCAAANQPTNQPTSQCWYWNCCDNNCMFIMFWLKSRIDFYGKIV